MNLTFYLASALSIASTLMVIVGKNAVHSLLYLIVSLLSVSVIFFILGAPFIAALEVIIYAGAIMVLFVFVVMMLNMDEKGEKRGQEVLKAKNWIGPSFITAVLLCELVYLMASQKVDPMVPQEVTAGAVGQLMFSKYILVADLAAFLLAAGIIGAYQLGRKEKINHHRYFKKGDLTA